MRATVLIVDDEPNILEGLRQTLRQSRYEVVTANGPVEALVVLQERKVDVVISDHLMPGMTGIELLGLVHDRQPDAVRIMLSGHADAETVIRTINEGEVYRFLTKPCDRTELLVTLHLACEKLELERENRRLLALVRSDPELVARLERAGAGPRPAGGDGA
ncbi:MAG TPA: response regulator [Anaeromyxobacteraceae bacterium]|nr:response regulator [Anaeromyxobacteraceae bacterium]